MEMEGLSYGFSGGNGSSRRVNRFNRNSVGRVLRPHMMDETGAGGGKERNNKGEKGESKTKGEKEESENKGEKEGVKEQRRERRIKDQRR